MAIFLLYNRKFWFRMAWGTLPEGWMGLSHNSCSPCLWICIPFQ